MKPRLNMSRLWLTVVLVMGLWPNTATSQPTQAPRSVVFARSYSPLPQIPPTPTDSLALTRPRDRWLGYDKLQHVTFSFLSTLSNQYVLVNKFDLSEKEAFPVSISLTASLGLGKEVYDQRRGSRFGFSYRDLVADAVGIGLAAAVIAW